MPSNVLQKSENKTLGPNNSNCMVYTSICFLRMDNYNLNLRCFWIQILMVFLDDAHIFHDIFAQLNRGRTQEKQTTNSPIQIRWTKVVVNKLDIIKRDRD